MPGTSDPPRPSLTSSVHGYLTNCSWANNRLEYGGTPVYGWLNQTGTPGQNATVYWEVGSATDAGVAVRATIPQLVHTIAVNGTWDQQTGRVSYGGKSYAFRFEVVSGAATMEPYAV